MNKNELKEQITKLQYANAVFMEKNAELEKKIEKLKTEQMDREHRNACLRNKVSSLIGQTLLNKLENSRGMLHFPTEVADEIGEVVGKYYAKMHEEEKLQHHYNGGQP